MMQSFWILNKYRKLSQRLISITTITICALNTSLPVAAEEIGRVKEPLPQRINFQHLLENKDIALGEVQAFLQDSQGFMWIGGGGGLVRYDGYEFKFIQQTIQRNNQSEKKPVKMVFYIYEDVDHIIWVSTRTGLLRYDPHTEVLAPVPDDPKSSVISTNSIYQVMQLPTGELLVGSANGLYILDRKTLGYSIILPDKTKPDGLHDILVKPILIDKNGGLWVGTGAGLEKIDWNTKTFTLYKPYPERPDLIEANTVTDIVQDNDGKFWLGTTDGLVNFDPVTLKSTRYVNDPADPNSMSGKEIAKLLVDSRGALWVTSDGGGVAIFEKSEQYPQGHFSNQKFEDGRPASLNSNQIRTVYEDRTGDVWVGNYPAGINYFDRSSAAITTYAHDTSDPKSISHSAILAVREDAQHNLWIGTDGGGLNFFDRQKNQFTSYRKDPNNPKTISGDAVLDDFIDEDGNVWAGTWGGGISILNPKTGEITRMPFDVARPKTQTISTSDRLNTSTVWSIKQDRQKNIWIGTHNGGLSKYDRATKTYTHYVPMENDPTSISAGPVWNILEDSKGNLWVGVATGLDLMDRNTGAFTHFKTDPKDPTSLSNPSATALHEDSKHRLWIGTEAGLNLLNPDGKTFTIYNKSSGFTDDNIRTILEDANGKLWLSTNNGISVFDPETKKVKNYNRDSGRLMGGFHTDSGIISDKGEIIFGGVEGLRVIDPTKLKDNPITPPIAFTGLKIFADAVNVGDQDGLLKESLSYTKTIVLDYKKSMFQFSFAALNFRDSSKNSYAYQLEGFDKYWLQVGDQRSAKYTNLNPGTYVFHVKGSNNDGIWNEEGAAITIIQLPPPWKTWWAYTLYALAIVAAIILFVQSQRKKRRLVEEQNRLLEIKVSERTAELREKNNDIQAMLSNMRQGLFTVEANGNIHPEYSRFLEEIFENKAIAGHNALALLFGNANLGSNELDQIKEAINAIIGEDEMNFDFNSHLLIQEYEVNFNGKSKYLSLDWNAVVVNDVVAKLMISVRDVTLLKKMENEARSKKRELDIIGQLLNVPAKKYLAFAVSTKRFIAENRAQIERNEQRSDAAIALLFRNMHTIKGNCRTFGFDYFSNVVHEVESVYSALKADPEINWNRDKLLSDLLRVEDILQEYERVYYTVLGRGEGSGGGRDQNGFWADSKAIETIQSCIDSVNKQFPMLSDSQPLLPIQTLLNRALSSPISEVLTDVVNSLPSIAIQLEKEAPQVIIKDNHVRMKSNANELMNNIFAHILRNCVDHGIEKPSVRSQAGKPAAGTIEIHALPQHQTLHIIVKDDGQGINIDRLFKKGVETGKWQAQDKPGYQDIAELIFASGVSTKDEVTNISGRGVGMDAVREFLLAQGGNISLNLLGPNADGQKIGDGVMVQFELVVELPQNLFTVMQ